MARVTKPAHMVYSLGLSAAESHTGVFQVCTVPLQLELVFHKLHMAMQCASMGIVFDFFSNLTNVYLVAYSAKVSQVSIILHVFHFYFVHTPLYLKLIP